MLCYKCGKETGLKKFVGRRDECPHCLTDAHVCKNCQFYDVKVYNECSESSAERVVDKEKANFCDQFVISNRLGGSFVKVPDLKSAAEALFKKKE
jgi:hypothetical protein